MWICAKKIEFVQQKLLILCRRERDFQLRMIECTEGVAGYAILKIPLK